MKLGDCIVCGNRDWFRFYADEYLEDDEDDDEERELAVVQCAYCGLEFLPEEVAS